MDTRSKAMNMLWIASSIVGIMIAISFFQNTSALFFVQNTNITTNNSENATLSSSAGQQCDKSLWNNVYHPSRLQVVDPCVTVSGVIDSIKVESDGDNHIRLKLDAEFANLLNNVNLAAQFGDLVIEPICQNKPILPAAIQACQGFHRIITIPQVGSHVSITGVYVLDTEHGWMEIHPVTSLKPS